MNYHSSLDIEEPFFLGDWFPPDCPEEINKHFINAIYENNLSQFLELLSNGADPNTCDEDPLLVAIKIGNIEIVKALLGEDFNPNLEDSERYTILMFAAYAGHLEIVQMLLDAGANINAISKDGDTALAMAVLAEKQEIVEYLSPLVSEEARKHAELYRNLI